MIELNGKYTNAKIMIDEIEPECMEQIIKMINHEAFTDQVRIMPDTHSGKGSVIGFTMPMGEKVIPNVVGVDLNCGILSVNIGQKSLNHIKLDKMIRERVPFGINVNKKPILNFERNIMWKDGEWEKFLEMCERIEIDHFYVQQSLCSLGGGNHFIEIGESLNNSDIWITVHTGSRNLGKKVCEYWQRKAHTKNVPDYKTSVAEIKANFHQKDWQKEILKIKQRNHALTTKSELDFLEGDDIKGYLSDVKRCAQFADLNRASIMATIMEILKYPEDKLTIQSVHNYIDLKDNIIRKGAIRSYENEWMIIPLNMSDGILICKGKSNPDWNFSAPHGAGRIYSRSKAKEVLSVEEFKKEMEGVFSTSVDYNTIDESPMAYKNSDMIIRCIEPTATIFDRILPIHNMKDSGDEKPWKKRKKDCQSMNTDGIILKEGLKQ